VVYFGMNKSTNKNKPSTQSEPVVKFWPEGEEPPEDEIAYRFIFTVEHLPKDLKFKVVSSQSEPEVPQEQKIVEGIRNAQLDNIFLNVGAPYVRFKRKEEEPQPVHKVYWEGTNIPRSVSFWWLPWEVKRKLIKKYWGI
jgi:hypothetical protein